jgi:hypothetical protein
MGFPSNWFCAVHAEWFFMQFYCLSSVFWKRSVNVLS